jgi:hypothetical protein
MLRSWFSVLQELTSSADRNAVMLMSSGGVVISSAFDVSSTTSVFVGVDFAASLESDVVKSEIKL